MRKLLTPEQFHALEAQFEQRNQERRGQASSSGMPPRSEWKQDVKPVSLKEVFAQSTKEANERAAKHLEEVAKSEHAWNGEGLKLPKSDPIRQKEFNEYFGIIPEEDKIATLEARIKELEENNAK